MSPSQAPGTSPGKVGGAGDNVLELGEVDGAVLVDVGLLQDLWGRGAVSSVPGALQCPCPGWEPSRFG